MQSQQTAQVIVTVDVLILKMDDDGRYSDVLLIQRRHDPCQGMWALPGGKLNEEDATLEDAARREVREETGIALEVIWQLHAYGNKDRDPRGRYVSVCYLALLPDGQEARAGDDAHDAAWYSVHAPLPALAFDHQRMIEDAHNYFC